MGHLGYRPSFEKAFEAMGTCMLFVYRDLRDVAVSQTYHIENEDDVRFKHPGKEIYQKMESHEARIQAVVEGIEEYAGIVERWELYAPWLEVAWVLPIRFEDMRTEPKKVAHKVVDYVFQRTMQHNDFLNLMIAEDYKKTIERAIDQMGIRETGSFRAGRQGDWRREFTPEITESFNNSGGSAWLKSLGYE